MRHRRGDPHAADEQRGAAALASAGAPQELRLTLPGLGLKSEANARGGWRWGANRARDQRAVVALAIGPRALPPLPCEVRITREGPGTLDDDNLARSAKAVRDELAHAIGADDGDPRITWHYAQRKAKRASVYVVIRHLPPNAPAAVVEQFPERAVITLRLTAAQRAQLAAGGAVDLPNAAVVVVEASDP